MSKSLGNVPSRRKSPSKMGAEILRPWVASTDYSGELSISRRSSTAWSGYRRLRNTLRFLLANTADFVRHRHAAGRASGWRSTVTRWPSPAGCRPGRSRLCRLRIPPGRPGAAELRRRRSRRGPSRRPGKIASTPPQANSAARRSAQSALWHILQSVVRLMAPILSFTAEEIWQLLTKDADDSVMLHFFHARPPRPAKKGCWRGGQRSARSAPTCKGDRGRPAPPGQVGSSLQAEVEIRAAGGNAISSPASPDDLRFVLICSKTTLVRVAVRSGQSHRRPPRRPTRNANAAGTTATTSATMPVIRNFAAAARPTYSVPAKRDRIAGDPPLQGARP